MGSTRDLDLADLLARVRDGDAIAWVKLTDRFTNLLWSIARGVRLSEADAADVVQTTWLKLLEKVNSIRDPERLGAWLATTARRECYSVSRQTARERPGDPSGWDGLNSGADPLDTALLRDERDVALWRAFAALKPSCQELLRVLIADPAPSYHEVAASLHIPVGSIGPTRQRCLKCLREILLTEDGSSAGLTPGREG